MATCQFTLARIQSMPICLFSMREVWSENSVKHSCSPLTSAKDAARRAMGSLSRAIRYCGSLSSWSMPGQSMRLMLR